MRALTSKNGDPLSHFDKNDESEAEVENISLHHHLFNNNKIAAKKGKIKSHQPLEHIFGFFRTFEKITKFLGFYLTFKFADLQDFIHTTLGEDIKVNFDKVFLCVPIFIPYAKTQLLFNDSIEYSFRLSFDSRSTDRKTVDTHFEYHVDIVGA